MNGLHANTKQVFLNEQESPKENTKENTEHGKTRMRIKTSRLGRAELYRQHNRAAAARVGALGLHMLRSLSHTGRRNWVQNSSLHFFRYK